MGLELLLLGGNVSAASSVAGNGRSPVAAASLHPRGPLLGSAPRRWRWRHTTSQKPQRQRCCATPELRRGDVDDGKLGFEKEILRPGTGPKPVKGQMVTVHCTGYGKDGDLSEKFWSTKDPGQETFSFNIGLGSVIKGWDEGVLTMQLGEVARITCTPDYAYGTNGFPSWGIKPNSVLIFEIEVLSVN